MKAQRDILEGVGRFALRPSSLGRPLILPRSPLWPEFARRWVRRATAVAVVASLGGAAAAPLAGRKPPGPQAGTDPIAAAGGDGRGDAVMRAVMGPGADVDGDGAPDFVNPTGRAMRDADNFGSGAYHASRDEGARLHQGADFLALPGQAVAAPISGYVTKIGYAYADNLQLRYVELTNPAIGYMVRVFYVSPSVTVGQAVRLGRPIGTALTLQARYPGISDHVHVEVTRLGEGHVDPANLIPQPTLRPVGASRVASASP